MRAVAAFTASGLRLYLRNRLALVYGYAVPLVFLAAYAVLYRYEAVPVVGHLGQLLTVTALGGACFGLPTTLVSERERGYWRMFRLAPVPLPVLVGSTLALRFGLLLSAALLQLLVALAIGMPPPAHLPDLLLAYACVAWALLGLGLVIAALADTVPAVQALGQCIFLPMLVIGGVAVPLAGLPAWTQQLALYFPGVYAVDALQAAASGSGRAPAALAALLAWGAAALVVGAALLRWDPLQRSGARRVLAGLAVLVLVAAGVGLLARAGGYDATSPALLQAPTTAPWSRVTAAMIDRDIDFTQLPPDDGIVTPVAADGEELQPELINALNLLRNGLDDWPPAQTRDPLERARAELRLAGAIDLMQLPMERQVPRMIYTRLQREIARDALCQVLYWIALHPEPNAAALPGLAPLGLPEPAPQPRAVEARAAIYAVKLLGRLEGRLPTARGP